MKKTASLIMFLLVICPDARAIDVTASGSWDRTITAADLISGAGSDLNGAYESPAGATSVSIANCADSADAWRIDVNRTGGTWPGTATLMVRRTSDGSGNGSVSGGLSSIEVGAGGSQFFSGTGDRSGISVQYTLSGISIQNAPGIYSTTVVFTVVDTL